MALKMLSLFCTETQNYLKIIHKEKITGDTLLKLTEKKLRSYGIKGGLATKIANFAKECKEKKLHLYRT